MGAAHRTVVLAAAIAGGAAFSQAPELAQQYRQRLGGALAELQQFVADFDRDAAANGLERQQALGLYAASHEKFLNRRGTTMRNVLSRFDRLTRQRADFAGSRPALQPLALVKEHDGKLLAGTWRDFRPGVPLTMAGALWTVIGALLAASILWLPAPLARGVRRRWRRRGDPVRTA